MSITLNELKMRYDAALLRSIESSVYDGKTPLYEIRYNHNHDGKGRFCSGGSSVRNITLKQLDKSAGSDIIKENIIIGRSVGAASKNYPVRLPSGNHAKIVEGTEITGIKTFAGKGTNVPIKTAKLLEAKYFEKAEQWEKVRGTAIIRENGVNKKVEIHWYEANGKRVEMKVKRYYNEG